MRCEIVELEDPATHSVATAPTAGCVIKEEWIGGTVVICASGVLDMLTSPQLEDSIEICLRKNPSAVVVDLTDVDFLASAGMGVLVVARDKVAPGAQFGVVANGPATSRPLQLVGLADLIGLYKTLDEALATLGE